MVAHFLVFGCGTKTKTKTQSESEVKAKETAKVEDSTVHAETFIASKLEEKQKELENDFRKENNSEDLEVTVTEVVEIESKEPIYMELNDGRFLNINNGRITKTKTTTTGKRKKNEIINFNEKIAEKSQSKIDSSNQIIIAKKAGIESAKEYLETQKSNNKEKVQEGWQPGFWFWFWIVLLVILIILFIYFYRKYGSPIGWFKLLFG